VGGLGLVLAADAITTAVAVAPPGFLVPAVFLLPVGEEVVELSARPAAL